MKGKSIVLLTLDTLDEIFYYTSMSREKRMYKSIESVKEDLDAGKTLKLRKTKEQKTLF
jgi:ERCC4-related helicase